MGRNRARWSKRPAGGCAEGEPYGSLESMRIPTVIGEVPDVCDGPFRVTVAAPENADGA